MATHILGADQAVLLPQILDGSREVDCDAGCEASEAKGGAFRGLFFVMGFNAALALTGVMGWELWHLVR